MLFIYLSMYEMKFLGMVYTGSLYVTSNTLCSVCNCKVTSRLKGLRRNRPQFGSNGKFVQIIVAANFEN